MNRMVGPNAHTPDGSPADAEYVIYRLEEAGSTLLALPGTGYTTRLRTTVMDVVRDTVEAFAGERGRVRPPVPPAARITRMDESLGWIALIPSDRYVLRRIVGARALVSPVTERHLFTWRRLAGVLGADHKAVQRWHAQGIALIVHALNSAPLNGALRGAGVNAVESASVPRFAASVNGVTAARAARAGS